MLKTDIFENTKAPYLQIYGDFPIDLPNNSFISLTRETPLKIHSLGFQPAKAIPEISRWFLQKYGNLNFRVLEPFSGSGTTLIEAIKFGVSTAWLDYHPLSRLICKIKTTRFSILEVQEEINKVIRKAINHQDAPSTINFANKDFWFQKPVQEGLEILRQLILKAKTSVQPLLWLALSSTVRKTSDMNDGMLLAAKRSHIEKIPPRSRSDVFDYFQYYVNKALDAIAEWDIYLWGKEGFNEELPYDDARTIKGINKYDAIITSPPYINAIDYVWASKFELHWLEMVKSDDERLSLYEKEIGTERISKSECKEVGQTGHSYLDKLILNIYSGQYYKATKGQNELRARVVYKYFEDMKSHFASSFLSLKPDGLYCFAIGDNSRICGVDIPVADLLSEIACEIGFEEIFKFHLLLKNRKLNIPRNVDWAGTIKHDSVLVLRKPS